MIKFIFLSILFLYKFINRVIILPEPPKSKEKIAYENKAYREKKSWAPYRIPKHKNRRLGMGRLEDNEPFSCWRWTRLPNKYSNINWNWFGYPGNWNFWSRPWLKKNYTRTPYGPYWLRLNDIPRSKYTDNKEVLANVTLDSYIPRDFYMYNDTTPFISNEDFKKKYLNKHKLKQSDRNYVNELLEKRRHLMDQYGKYNFSRVYYNLLEQLEYEKLKKSDPKLANLWDTWNKKLHYSKYHTMDGWESFKEKSLYFSHDDMKIAGDLEAIYRDYFFHVYHERRRKTTFDRCGGQKVDRINPIKPHNIYFRQPQELLKQWLWRKEWRTSSNKKIQKLGYWAYHDSFTNQNKLRYCEEPIYFIDVRNKFHYFEQKKFRHDLPFILRECRNLIKVNKHRRVVRQSWDYLLDNKVSYKDKFKKFWNGELWLLEEIPFHQLGFGWGKEYKKHKEGKSEIYQNAELASQYGFIGGVFKNEYTQNFKQYDPIHRAWNWADSRYPGNFWFIKAYFKPWMKVLSKRKQNINKGFDYWELKDKNKDIFWFKWSHKELKYFRKPNDVSTDPVKFHSVSLFIDQGQMLNQIKRTLTFDLTQMHPKQRDFVKSTLKKKTKTGYWVNFIPKKYLPASYEVNYYKYVGPNYWMNNIQAWGFNVPFNTAWPINIGPANIPFKANYYCFYEHFWQYEFVQHFRMAWLPGLSWYYQFYMSESFIYIFLPFCLIFIIYFCCLGFQGPQRDLAFKMCYTVFKETLRKDSATGLFTLHIDEWKSQKPVLEFLKRHHLNALLSTPIWAYFTIEFLCYWFIEFHHFGHNFYHWLILLWASSIGFIFFFFFMYWYYRGVKRLEKYLSKDEYSRFVAIEREWSRVAYRKRMRALELAFEEEEKKAEKKEEEDWKKSPLNPSNWFNKKDDNN